LGVLRWVGKPHAPENNIGQTVASTAGTLSSIIFVLPGFVMIGWWTGFPYWQSVAICATGGILGVMYSIPLRRRLGMVQTRLFLGDVARSFRLGSDARAPVTGFDFQLSFALFGIGHLVGISCGLAMFVGALIGWGAGVPHYSAVHA